MVNKMGFELSDKTIEKLNIIGEDFAKLLTERAAKEQNELAEAFRATAINGKSLYDECLKQGLDKDEAIKFSVGFLVGLSK